MDVKKGLLVILIGPSGCGKGTVLNELLKGDKNTFLSISATTRAKRLGEQDGKNYFYIEKEEFISKLENGDMLEYAIYCDNYYGTPRDKVVEKINAGQNVILEIEVEGAKQVKLLYSDAVQVFLLPPSFVELKRRLIERNTEPQAVIEKRISTAKDELYYAGSCDYIIINDTIFDAVEDLKSIIRVERLKRQEREVLIEKIQNS